MCEEGSSMRVFTSHTALLSHSPPPLSDHLVSQTHLRQSSVPPSTLIRHSFNSHSTVTPLQSQSPPSNPPNHHPSSIAASQSPSPTREFSFADKSSADLIPMRACHHTGPGTLLLIFTLLNNLHPQCHAHTRRSPRSS